MFDSTPANVPYYLRFIERYASLGYAIAFSKTGDFFEAQAALERAFTEGYPTWAGRFARHRDSEETLRKILDRQLPHGAASPRIAPAASFAHSRKLQDVQEAQGILLGLPSDVMIAIFLEVVEEMPREKVARLLGKPPAFFEDVQAELLKGLQQWKPGEPQALEVFARMLRQYRLPPSFLNNIESKMDYSWRRTFNAPAVLRNVLIAAGVVVVLIFASRDGLRGFGYRPYIDTVGRGVGPYEYRYQEAAAQTYVNFGGAGGNNLLLWIDLLLLAAIIALKRGLERYEGEGLAMSGEFEHPLTSLAVLHTFGVILVTAGAVHFIKPMVFMESWVPIAYVASHAIFLPLAAAGIVRVLLRVLLHRAEARN
ncbi:MAG TPA: hypothetical protein VFS19_00525 [Planctomycetota bacterium]|nr:hypothetical protein [Planctomycetota bacterium]